MRPKDPKDIAFEVNISSNILNFFSELDNIGHKDNWIQDDFITLDIFIV